MWVPGLGLRGGTVIIILLIFIIIIIIIIIIGSSSWDIDVSSWVELVPTATPTTLWVYEGTGNVTGVWTLAVCGRVFILERTWGFQIRRWTFLINFVGKRGDDTSKVGLCSMHPVCSFEGEGSQRFISCSQEEIREVLGTWRECRRNTEEANTNTFWRRNKSLRSGWEIWPTMLPGLQTHKLALSKRKRNM